MFYIAFRKDFNIYLTSKKLGRECVHRTQMPLPKVKVSHPQFDGAYFIMTLRLHRHCDITQTTSQMFRLKRCCCSEIWRQITEEEFFLVFD